MLNKHPTPLRNLSFKCIFFFMHCFIQDVKNMFKNFAIVLWRYWSTVYFSYNICGLGIWVILTLWYNLESIPSFSSLEKFAWISYYFFLKCLTVWTGDNICVWSFLCMTDFVKISICMEDVRLPMLHIFSQ